MDILLDTPAAAQWLTAHGVRRSPATLRKLRCIGGGPHYRLLNGKPYYVEPDLIAWIEQRLSAPLRNSSERVAAAARLALFLLGLLLSLKADAAVSGYSRPDSSARSQHLVFVAVVERSLCREAIMASPARALQ
jgi:hypothetical protein